MTKIVNKKKMPSNLFFCCTYFHFYVALALAWEKFQAGQKNTIVLSLTKNQIIQGLNKRLSAIHWAKIIDITDLALYDQIEKSSPLNKFFLNLFLVSRYPALDPGTKIIEKLIRANQIYLFNDFHYLARYILKKAHHPICLVQDGTSNYLRLKKTVFTYTKMLIGIYPRLGRHPKISRILVQKPDKLPDDIRNKGRLLHIKHIFNQIPTTIHQSIINLFIDKLEITGKTTKPCVLLLTQPYFDFGRINFNQHMQLYNLIIDRLKAFNTTIYIKPHPSDRIDYHSLLTDVNILPAAFPIEILNHAGNFNIDMTIGINTSAVFNIGFSKKALNLLQHSDKFIQHHFDESIRLIEKTLIQNLSNQGFVKSHA
jgi:hypothetical protein